MQVYTLLVNPDNPRYPRTQAQVAHKLPLKAERVSEAVKALLKMDFIAEITDGRRHKLYRPGKNREIIESQIRSIYSRSPTWFDSYGRAFTPQQHANPAGYQNVTSTWRTHLNGGWIQFPVLQEGPLEHLAIRIPKPNYPLPKEILETEDQLGRVKIKLDLFKRKTKKDLPGQENYYTSIVVGTSAVEIRYQRTPNVRFLYISPGEDRQITEQLDDEDLDCFLQYCYPILDQLEKNEWKFQREPNSNTYAFKASVRKEFGADPYISGIMQEVLGEDYGIPGKTEIWIDRSVPGGEFETNRADIARHIVQGPELYQQLLARLMAMEALLERVIYTQQQLTVAVKQSTDIEQSLIGTRLQEREVAEGCP